MHVVTFEVRKVLGKVVVSSLNAKQTVRVEENYPGAILPKTILIFIVFVVDNAQAVHLALVPPASVSSTVLCHFKCAITILIVITILTFVPVSVRTDVNAVTMHLSLAPVTVVLAAIIPNIDPIPVLLVICPVPVIAGPVRPRVDALTMLLILVKPSLVLAFRTSVDFHTLAFLHVVDPVTAVLFSRFFLVDSFTVEHVAAERAFVNVSRPEGHLALSAGLVVVEAALKSGPVNPHHRPKPMSQVSIEFAGVCGASRLVVVCSVFESRVGGKERSVFSYELHGFFSREILS